MNKKSLISIAAVVACASACTGGVVYDEAEGSYLGKAKVRFQKVNFNAPLQIRPTIVNGSIVPVNNDVFPALSASVVSAATWDSGQTGAHDGHGVYYLNPYGNITYGTSLSVTVSGGWNRIRVSRTGYEERIFYRNHLYGTCQVPEDQGPVSANSNYPFVMPTEGPFWDAQRVGSEPTCAIQHFALRRSSTSYPLDPDLMIDLRGLRDHVVTQDCSDLTSRDGRCLRVSLAIANVGVGPLEIRAAAPGATIEQVRYDSTANVRATLFSRLPSSSQFQYVSDGHDHMHLTGFVRMLLRRIESRCATELTAANCAPTATSDQKIGFCLADSEKFDSGLRGYNPSRTYQTGLCSSSARPVRMGISVGWYDLYDKSVRLQGFFLDDPLARVLAGDYWLEAEVNPVNSAGQRAIIESDYSNNITRLKVTIPR